MGLSYGGDFSSYGSGLRDSYGGHTSFGGSSGAAEGTLSYGTWDGPVAWYDLGPGTSGQGSTGMGSHYRGTTFNPTAEAAYLAANPDVAAAVAAGNLTAAQHYERFGKEEGRSLAPAPSPAPAPAPRAPAPAPAPAPARAPANFNEAAYLAANPDVAAAVRSGLIGSGAAHFASHGRAEGRSPTGATTTTSAAPATTGGLSLTRPSATAPTYTPAPARATPAPTSASGVTTDPATGRASMPMAGGGTLTASLNPMDVAVGLAGASPRGSFDLTGNGDNYGVYERAQDRLNTTYSEVGPKGKARPGIEIPLYDKILPTAATVLGGLALGPAAGLGLGLGIYGAQRFNDDPTFGMTNPRVGQRMSYAEAVEAARNELGDGASWTDIADRASEISEGGGWGDAGGGGGSDEWGENQSGRSVDDGFGDRPEGAPAGAGEGSFEGGSSSNPWNDLDRSGDGAWDATPTNPGGSGGGGAGAPGGGTIPGGTIPGGAIPGGWGGWQGGGGLSRYFSPFAGQFAQYAKPGDWANEHLWHRFDYGG